MIINDNPIEWVLYVAVCAMIFAVGLIIAARPEVFVRHLGRFLRRYAIARNLTDSQADQMIPSQTRHFYGGALSNFIQSFDRFPEAYPQLMSYVRWFGILMVAFVVGMNLIGLLFWAAASLSPFLSICPSSQPNCVP